LVDELHLHVPPGPLDAGMRLFNCLPRPVSFEVAALIWSAHTTHIRYRRRPLG
jgi:hypothetical protein